MEAHLAHNMGITVRGEREVLEGCGEEGRSEISLEEIRRPKLSPAPSSPADRVESAKEDLRRAGYVADAALLNVGRLNTAWQHLSKEVKGQYLRERTLKETKKRTTGAQSTDGSRKQRLIEAQTNMDIARSIGLAPAPTLEENDDGGGALEEDIIRGFYVNIETEQSSDPRVQQGPLAGAVLHEKGTFEHSGESTCQWCWYRVGCGKPCQDVAPLGEGHCLTTESR